MYETLEAKADEMECHLLETGGTRDHVHTVAAIRPSVAVSEFVSKIKATSSRKLSREFSALSDFSWQRGYAAFTVSPDELGAVRRYVRNQKEHHRSETLWDILEELDL